MFLSSTRPKILVVEDDAPLAHLYCTALALWGMSSMRVADGLAALRALEQYHPDLVLLDLAMPMLDGSAVLRECAAREDTSDIPVIVITGVDSPPELPHAAMVLHKPCDAD